MKTCIALLFCGVLGSAFAADPAPASLMSNTPAATAPTNGFWVQGSLHKWAVPAASHFATVEDIAAPPLALEDIGEYQTWLERLPPRAFAVNGKTGFGIGYGAKAMKTALDNCEAVSHSKCWLYAVDDQVVYAANEAQRIGLGQAGLPDSKLNAVTASAEPVSAPAAPVKVATPAKASRSKTPSEAPAGGA
ncbi:hypothetical protein [Amantichitinum ursilacus]|uniref:DUF4189 domain-containing protein n=1 Tax=Amantichitinum ursilacus TaxID=857265 RepID=A0A0N1JRP6_9NEIS|nr:hypothetical protein [Amantichitinum ursilacus]KPC49291.1 hypothetical protein WG78_20385 [Amantichitinum ursilacus]